MTHTTAIASAPSRAMTAVQECAVLRAAARGGTASPAVLLRLAALLNQLDDFDETIQLLGDVPDAVLGHEGQLLLAAAYFAHARAGDTERALDAAGRALAAAGNDAERASALAEQAKALIRLDRSSDAREMLERALEYDPHNREACKRLALDLLLSGETAAALDLTDTLIARGAGHARLLAARATALAKLGDHDAARRMLDLATFLHQGTIDPPAGWDTLSAFNQAVAAELLAHPALRYGRHGTASVESWRIDSLVAGDGPLARLLVAQIIAATQRQVDALHAIDHPWIAARPRQAALRSWCVITEGSGFEHWHMHPFGWMSGVYYVQVPDAPAGDDRAGCLALGLPDTLIGADAAAAIGDHLVRPAPGLLALFPSHSYHHTFPHRAAGKRICVAFDVEPR